MRPQNNNVICGINADKSLMSVLSNVANFLGFGGRSKYVSKLIEDYLSGKLEVKESEITGRARARKKQT